MEILYKKEKEEADQLLEQQRLVRLNLYDNSCFFCCLSRDLFFLFNLAFVDPPNLC